MTDRIEKISLEWFLTEPALFMVMCSHNVVANTGMNCPMRSGQLRIEYNPMLCKDMPDEMLRDHLKAECIRILLKHPYSRRPTDCSAQAIVAGSNCAVSDSYRKWSIRLDSPKGYKLERGECFEFYAKAIERLLRKVQQVQAESGNSLRASQGKLQGSNQDKSQDDCQESNQTGGGKQKSSKSQIPKKVKECAERGDIDSAEMWEEDEVAAADINQMIDTLALNQKWGSISADMVDRIIASTKVKIDYRRVLQLLRTEVISSQRRLTRMRPSRRFGFDYMGSVHQLTSRLLIAVDTSGSVNNEQVGNFFGIVNRFFKYGIEHIDVIMFDYNIKGKPMTMKKAKKDTIKIFGRGGTSFQCVIDYAAQSKTRYQGLIIFTDGYAPVPTFPPFFKVPILWALIKDGHNHDELKETGRLCYIENI